MHNLLLSIQVPCREIYNLCCLDNHSLTLQLHIISYINILVNNVRQLYAYIYTYKRPLRIIKEIKYGLTQSTLNRLPLWCMLHALPRLNQSSCKGARVERHRRRPSAAGVKGATRSKPPAETRQLHHWVGTPKAGLARGWGPSAATGNPFNWQ